MPSINEATILGHLGSDPDIRNTRGGESVCNLSIATTERWKDKNSGEKREQTEWHRVVLWRRQAEIAGQYLRKGSLVWIRGRLQTRKWQDRDGNDRYTTEIQGKELLLMPQSQGGGQGQAPPPQDDRPMPTRDEDIPF